jgi:DNA-directed RNA polymerase subunit E'/Rpb7
MYIFVENLNKKIPRRRLNFHGATTKNSSLQINILVRCICFVFLIHAIIFGKVVSCGDDGPVVNFPSIDVTTKLDKINFSGNYLQFISICIILKGL